MLITQFLLRRKALTRYQMLFRHMFYCKHVERLLCNVWISNKDFKQYSLRSPKWWVCVKLASVNLRKNRYTFSHSSNCCTGLLLRLPSGSACWTLCRTSSTTWCLRWWSPTGTLWRTTWRQWVNDTGDAQVSTQMRSFLTWLSSSTGIKHWWRSLSPHQLPGQLLEGLHVDQPGAPQNLLQTHGCLHHVHKLHAGANVLGKKKKISICNYYCYHYIWIFIMKMLVFCV